MEKNTILAVVLSTVVLIVFYMMQGAFSPQQPQVQEYVPPPVTAAPDTGVPQQPMQEVPDRLDVSSDILLEEIFEEVYDAGPQSVQHVTIGNLETDLFQVVLTNAGGNVVSWRLKDHLDDGDHVDMIFSGTNEAQAFSIAFGGLEAQPVTSLFYVNRISNHTVEFYRDFTAPQSLRMDGSDGRFRLTKRYDFKPNDYMFELTITLDGGFSVPYFNFAGNAYTLSFGPQIGPRFEQLNNRYDYRQYVAFINGRRRDVRVNDVIDSRPAWAAIAGKYFTVAVIPYLAQYSIVFTDTPEAGLSSASRMNIIRPADSSRISDTYRFYLGPKTQNILAAYNTGLNEFNLRDTSLVELASSRGILAPLENILKWFLLLFYRVAPNYGIAIILLTLFIKIVFFPLTKKGSEATMRMQALAPKIKEIQDKYKGNPQKMQLEMAAFYKQEGYNPISGCLPMLLQFPIFIAMYNLFNNHFDLRGAMFIPGWIPDLSVPEYVWLFPDGVTLPLLGWNALRLLPFIYVGSQLIYGRVTRMPGQQGNTQMKMMLYVMPIAFFFILYNVPSGLLIYWIFSNILTMVQQLIINEYVKKKQAQTQTQTETKPVIAPPKKKK